MSADLSLIVPTRQRLPGLRRLLDSLANTAGDLERLEIVLVVDADDGPSEAFRDARFNLRTVVVPPGLTMGAINSAGYEASGGRYLMLLNDDVVARTPGWDDTVRACFRGFPDEIVLVHTNDLTYRDGLCTFPIVSRTFCELAGGICPPEYLRYRIDDHIGDLFNMLGELGERRTIYLPDVVFEHENFTVNEQGQRNYASLPGPLAHDAALFDALHPRRKETVLRLRAYLDRLALNARADTYRRKLDQLDDPFALRYPERLRGPTPSRAGTRVTVGVLTADATSNACRRCLKRINRHTSNHELVVIEEREAALPSPRGLNRLLAAAATEHVALLTDQVLVSPGWLDGLLAAMAPDVGVVTPLQQPWDDDTCYSGVVFEEDGSGAHRQVEIVPDRIVPVLGFCNSVLLLDRVKCGLVRFDEAFQHYFHDLDFALRMWEAGLKVVCTPAVRVRMLTAGPLPYGPLIHPAPYEADRELFQGRWLTGRLDRVRAGTAAQTWPPERSRTARTSNGKQGWSRVLACVEHRGPAALARALWRRVATPGG